MKKKTFKQGTVVIWDSANFNPDYWNNLSEIDRVKYYGALGYGSEKKKLFVFMCEINDSGHCVLVDLDDGHIEKMRHTCEFRKATDDEF